MCRTVRGMGLALSDHHVVLCKDRLVGAWIKRTEIVNWARRISSEKLKEHQCIDVCAKCLENKRVEWYEHRNAEEVKQAMVDSAKEVYGSVRVGEKNPECVVE